MSRQAKSRQHSTPRLDPVEDPSPEQAELLESYRTFSGGEPFNIFRTLARHPKLMKRAMVLATGLLVKGNLPPRIREIVILRVAWRTGSDYEWGQHVRIGLDSGLAREEIDALATEEADGSFDGADRLAVTVTDELMADVDLSDATWEAAVATWGEEDLVEMIFLAGNYRMLAGFLKAARVELDEGLEPLPTPPPPA
jgi:4-carboxymuconolactone decarboxylase